MSLVRPLRSFFQEPLVLLVLIGAAIYGGYRYLEAREESREEARIHLAAEQLEGLFLGELRINSYHECG